MPAILQWFFISLLSCAALAEFNVDPIICSKNMSARSFSEEDRQLIDHFRGTLRSGRLLVLKNKAPNRAPIAISESVIFASVSDTVMSFISALRSDHLSFTDI